MSIEKVNSAVEMVLPLGVFITTIVRHRGFVGQHLGDDKAFEQPGLQHGALAFRDNLVLRRGVGLECNKRLIQHAAFDFDAFALGNDFVRKKAGRLGRRRGGGFRRGFVSGFGNKHGQRQRPKQGG